MSQENYTDEKAEHDGMLVPSSQHESATKIPRYDDPDYNVEWFHNLCAMSSLPRFTFSQVQSGEMEVLDVDTFLTGFEEYHKKHNKPCDMKLCWQIIQQHCKASSKKLRQKNYDDNYSRVQPDDVYQ